MLLKTLKIVSQQMQTANPHYPCLCVAIQPALWMFRVIAFSPISSKRLEPGATHLGSHGCPFIVSRNWLIYCVSAQLFYVPYALISNLLRFKSGPSTNVQFNPTWYVATGGFFIFDANNIVAMASSCIWSKRQMDVLKRLSRMPGSVSEYRKMSHRCYFALALSLCFYLSSLASYMYIVWKKVIMNESSHEFDLIDSSVGSAVRGITSIFTISQTVLVFVFCLCLASKLDHLTQCTHNALSQAEMNVNKASSAANNGTYRLVFTKIKQVASSPQLLSQNETETEYDETISVCKQFDNLAENHRELTNILESINACLSPQLLVDITTCLYITICYLYRVATYDVSSDADTNDIDNPHAYHLHFYIALALRIVKLMVYCGLGQYVCIKYTQPLKVLQRAKISNLQPKLQQQLQILLLQWTSTGKCYLEASGVVKVGPWLFAPITGSIITYLLVALQFKQSAESDSAQNFTALLASVF